MVRRVGQDEGQKRLFEATADRGLVIRGLEQLTAKIRTREIAYGPIRIEGEEGIYLYTYYLEDGRVFREVFTGNNLQVALKEITDSI